MSYIFQYTECTHISSTALKQNQQLTEILNTSLDITTKLTFSRDLSN